MQCIANLLSSISCYSSRRLFLCVSVFCPLCNRSPSHDESLPPTPAHAHTLMSTTSNRQSLLPRRLSRLHAAASTPSHSHDPDAAAEVAAALPSTLTPPSTTLHTTTKISSTPGAEVTSGDWAGPPPWTSVPRHSVGVHLLSLGRCRGHSLSAHSFDEIQTARRPVEMTIG